MDSTNNIPTTPNCGFESLIEDEEAACLVRRITLTSYDDLYRLVKASISPDDLPNSESTPPEFIDLDQTTWFYLG